jgi:hypothetical protein
METGLIQENAMSDKISARLMSLQSMKLDELRAMWVELYGKQAPEHNRPYMIKRLSYRIQELAYGCLSNETQQRINNMIKGGLTADIKSKGKLTAGTRLIREYQGIEHQVTVQFDGFEYLGQRFKSLSAVARKITGTRWNGPKFFGVRS